MHNYKRLDTILKILITISILLGVSCSGGGVAVLNVSDINGPGTLNEHEVADYSITVERGLELGYSWTLTPQSAGQLTNVTTATVTLQPNEVTEDITARLTVNITGWKTEPVVVIRDVTITDTNQLPNAAASADKTRIGHGESVQFTNESTDPEGDDDIILFEWDFSYVEDDGFFSDSEDRDPRQLYEVPGIYNVQLRITDRSNVTDMLTEPIVIEVVENYAPVISEVNHNRTTSQVGNDNEAVELVVLFNDPAPVDDEITIRWECDYGYFDDETSQHPVWFPPDSPVKCEIRVIVTDWFGLSDSGSCNQWVTSMPTLVNGLAPGNLMIPVNFETVFNGSINPANWVYPNDPNDGNVVFMSFWVTWCSTCVEGMPSVLAVNDLFETNPHYRHVMINEDEPVEEVFGFIYDNNYEAMYWALDTCALYFNQINGWNGGSNELPQHLLFDRDGRCRWAKVGPLGQLWDVQPLIEELL